MGRGEHRRYRLTAIHRHHRGEYIALNWTVQLIDRIMRCLLASIRQDLDAKAWLTCGDAS